MGDSVSADSCNTSDNLHNSCKLPLSINIFHSCTEQKPSSTNYCLLRLEFTLLIQKGPEHCQLDTLGKEVSADIGEMLNKSHIDVKLVQKRSARDKALLTGFTC